MFKGLFLSALCMLSCSAKAIVPSVDQTDCCEPKILEKREAVSGNGYANLIGVYNFKQDFGDVVNGLDDVQVTIDFPSYTLMSNTIYDVYYLDQIVLNPDRDDDEIFIQFYYHDSQDDYDAIFFIDSNSSLDDVTPIEWRSLVFYVNQSLMISGNAFVEFSSLFTQEDNAYTYTYTGWFHFTTPNPTMTNSFNFFGTYSYDQGVYFALKSFFNYQILTFPAITQYYYSASNVSYTSTNTICVPDKAYYLTGVKMSTASYNNLRNIGYFGYVPSSGDADNFYDMLFGVTDSSVYLIHSLLGFQLFGVDLFVAFTSMLTLIVILALIKRFW